MGVQGLWELLAPVGRRVSVEALGGKRLAVGEVADILRSDDLVINELSTVLKKSLTRHQI